MASPSTVDEYLQSLSLAQRDNVLKLRDVVLQNIDGHIEEGMQYGMLSYYVPKTVFPSGYHCDPKQPLPYLAIAARASGCSLHAMCLYIPEDSPLPAWFATAWKAAGKKLDMGKACVRFKNIDDVPLDVVAELIRRIPGETFLANYVAWRAKQTSGKVAKPKTSRSKKTANP
jgi:hypothetical protein